MITNLTGRSLSLYALAPADGLPPSALRPGEKPLRELPGAPSQVARVSLTFAPAGDFCDADGSVPLTRPQSPSPAQVAASLPPVEEGTLFVVTSIVAPHAWALGRRDVVHLGDAVLGPVPGGRSEQIGARGLVCAPERDPAQR